MIWPNVAKAPLGTSVPMTLVTIHEDASTSPSVSVEYPQFPSLPADLNTAIASSTLSRLAQFRQEAADNAAARAATTPADSNASADIPMSDYSFIASWQEAQVNDRYVSFIERYDLYSGGANENQEVQTFNYDVTGKQMMTLADLFPNVPDYLNKISDATRQQLTASMEQASNGNVPTDMLDAGTLPTADNFANFTFTDDLVNLYFPKYAVAPGAFGEQHATIVRSSIPKAD